jgi:hypothetical protein
MDTSPYYQRRQPSPQDPTKFNIDRVDISQCHLPLYPTGDARSLANSLFDSRAAAVVRAAVGAPPYPGPTLYVLPVPKVPPDPKGDLDPNALLERKKYGDSAPTILIPTPKCLAVMAYGDYFRNDPNAAGLQSMVSDAIKASSPGWCGSFGPDVSNLGSSNYEGNYDITQMFLLPLAYAYYDLLRPEAQEKLITSLLARGTIRRAALGDRFTSSTAPNDWSRAGQILGVDVPETENHILMIATARYLTNQLMYQRYFGIGEDWVTFDNRRNGDPGISQPSCLDQVLALLRNYLRDDFAEYNAKPYQEETRWALLNLYSYAYDAEVRVGAGMVLDYISAHIAVSSCDLRRLVPFRRRDEDKYVKQDPVGFIDIPLLNGNGAADPMAEHFAVHAGNTRVFAEPWDVRVWSWAISLPSSELFQEAACDHRLAPSVHDLFVNDLHRRFYQRLHRHSMMDFPGQQWNTDNLEIYSGSPSYLISAGGRPAIWVIPGSHGQGYQQQNLGVAVPITFMPTGGIGVTDGGATFYLPISDSRNLIQIMHLSDVPAPENGIQDADHGATENYGVAPDFACGVDIHLPGWTGVPSTGDGLFWVNGRSSDPAQLAGFYLAIHRWGKFVVLEAFDTWRYPAVSFDDFKAIVTANSPVAGPTSGVEAVYTTFFGNRIHYVIWQNLELDNHIVGSKILNIEYGSGDPAATLVDAGNDSAPFLSGNIMTSPRDGVVEIRNPSLGTTLTLDWGDPHHLVRTSETGDVQQAGGNFEVWVDFDWQGLIGPDGQHHLYMEGDFYRPFKTLDAALNAVADGGVIRIMRGKMPERLTIHKRVPVRLNGVGGTVTL